MRIRSVELEGLWAYRERQHLDLGGVPLIVGVGENGVGKSAILVHAIVAAFFQKFPTKTQGGSVTHGLSSGHVSVEFDMNDTVYRIGRVFPAPASARAPSRCRTTHPRAAGVPW